MRVISTRAAAGDPGVDLCSALAAGLAPDGGLYLPAKLPRVDLASLPATADLPDTAAALLAPFFADEALAAELPQLCREAFSFPAPLRVLKGPGRQGLLELFHGPTSAFKDYAAQFLAGALARIEGIRPLHVLVATSGDTGAAVAAAFHRREGFRVSVLYPEQGVSPRQAHLLGCFGDNVQSFRVQGSFDDCQRLVKSALADPVLRLRHRLTSANSISLGRLLPQMAYYAKAARDHLHDTGEAPGFIIPSGNFGNALACLWARWVGLPIGSVHLATNANRALVDWIETGAAEARSSQRTLANAMDVGLPSNLERLRWMSESPEPLRDWLSAEAVSDAQIRVALAAAPERFGSVVCPHTACALHALTRLREAGDRRPWIAVATAHPAKFPEVVEPLVGQPIPVPEAMRPWLARSATAMPLRADLAALSAHL